MNCPACGQETNSWVHCAMRQAKICQAHCEGCRWFSGRQLWACWYGRIVLNGRHRTRGEIAVEHFRNRMQEIEKRIAASKR